MPSWNELGVEFAKVLHLENEYQNDPILYISQLEEKHGKAQLVEYLYSFLHSNLYKPSNAHLSFAKLLFELVITKKLFSNSNWINSTLGAEVWVDGLIALSSTNDIMVEKHFEDYLKFCTSQQYNCDLEHVYNSIRLFIYLYNAKIRINIILKIGCEVVLS